MARRHTPEQVIAKVRQGQKMLNDGRPMVEVIKELQVTEATWYRWLNQYGSEKNAEASKRTKELEKENARLKRLLAEKELLPRIYRSFRDGCAGLKLPDSILDSKKSVRPNTSLRHVILVGSSPGLRWRTNWHCGGMPASSFFR